MSYSSSKLELVAHLGQC